MDASRIGAGWLVTCMIGGAVVVVTGYAANLPALIALGGVAIAVGIGGVIWDVSAAVQRRKSGSASAPTIHINHIDTFYAGTLTAPDGKAVSVSSNTALRVGNIEALVVAVPPGTLSFRTAEDSLALSDAVLAEIIGPMRVEPIRPPENPPD